MPIEEDPAEHALELPALSAKPGNVLSLRFRARLHHQQPAGWGNYLALRFNDVLLEAKLADNLPRVLNRRLTIATTDPKYRRVPLMQPSRGLPCLQVFFGPAEPGLDPRVITDRDEGYQYVVDVSDVARADGPNRLTLINTAVKANWGGNPTPDCRLIVEQIAVEQAPASRVAELRGLHLVHRSSLRGTRLTLPEITVSVPSGGGIQLDMGDERYFIESAFSFPRDGGMGYNHLACLVDTEERSVWRPVSNASNGTITLLAETDDYRLRRRISPIGQRIEITDALTNKTDEVIGIAVEHAVITPGFPLRTRINGLKEASAHGAGRFPENPTLFAAQARTGLGLVAEDNALRLQMGTRVEYNVVSLSANRLGLKPRETYTTRWSLYPGSTDYFDFVNQVRRDWDVNFTVDGPWDFFDAREITTEQGRKKARALLARKRLKLFALVPWFEYYNGWGLSRDEYRKLITDASRFIKEVVPDAKCMACLETNLVPVPLSFFGETIPDEGWPIGRYKGGKYCQLATPAMTALIEGSCWRDSCVRARDGNFLLDCWYVQHYDKLPALNLMVYPTLSNHRHGQMLEQLGWLLDYVGLDGIYIDQFSMAYNPSRDRFTHDQWDGRTVELDLNGRVSGKMADLGMLSAAARREWVEFALKRDKVVVCNSQPAVNELQNLAAFRFMETQGYDPLAGDGPPYQWRLARGHLGSPIGLGHSFHCKNDGADFFMRTVIAHLRHGLLYYYYYTVFPPDGSRGGEYGPVNQMFPFTPRELHEGWVLGEERLITCISGEFPWPHANEPRVLQFDSRGRQRPAVATVKRDGDGWRVQIKLRDWWEIAVLE